MVLGEGKNFFSREKPNVGFEILPFPKPQPFSRKAKYFFGQEQLLAGDYHPFSRKAKYFFGQEQLLAGNHLPIQGTEHFNIQPEQTIFKQGKTASERYVPNARAEQPKSEIQNRRPRRRNSVRKGRVLRRVR